MTLHVCIMYILTCNVCLEQYVGQTVKEFRYRWNNYRNNGRKYQEYGICMQQQLFEHFSEEGHCSFLEDISLNWLTKLTHQTLCREKTIGEVFWRQWRHVDWTLKNCYWNSVLLYSYHWISSGCNKDLIYRNNFGIDYYYCSYFHHYHYSCRFYDTLFFYCSCLRDCVGVLFVIIMVLVWSSPLLLSFL